MMAQVAVFSGSALQPGRSQVLISCYTRQQRRRSRRTCHPDSAVHRSAPCRPHPERPPARAGLAELCSLE